MPKSLFFTSFPVKIYCIEKAVMFVLEISGG
jgi:hypothetical protein